MNKFLIQFIVLTLLLITLPAVASAQGDDPTPLPRHCLGVGTLQENPAALTDPDFCGCTWGVVHYQGQPVVNAPVSISFSQQMTGTLSSFIAEVDDDDPFYSLSGAPLGAKRGDVMTVTVDFAGQTISRAFRADPNGAQEQEVPLVIPQRGVWKSTSSPGFTQAIAAEGESLWAVGTGGLRRTNPEGPGEIYQLPWEEVEEPNIQGANQIVRDLMVDTAGDKWVITADTVAQLSDGSWQTYTAPISGTLNALAVDPVSGGIYVGGGDSAGAIAIFDGTWTLLHTVAKPVTTLTVDAAGHLWAGTWGDGVHRRDETGAWTRFRAEDGLGSNRVWSAAASTGNSSAGDSNAGDSNVGGSLLNGLWFGTDVALSAHGIGGISYFGLADSSWRTYTSANGLPAVTDFPLASSPALALATDSNGRPWAATADGLVLLATEDAWATHSGPAEVASQLLIIDDQIYVATADDIVRLDRTETAGSPPTATITSQGPLSISQSGLLEITGSGNDTDDLGIDNNSTADPSDTAAEQILGWDWSSDVDGPLCTTADTCRIAARQLTAGAHQISLRVQDNEGTWSVADTISVTVTAGLSVYLPLVE